MTARDLTQGVAVRLAALSLDDAGRLSSRLIAADAVRCGLFVDLALSGRIESEDDSIVIDEQPTGFEPADRVLAAIAVEPERTLDGWLAEQRLGMRDVVAANLASGRWRASAGLPWRRRYSDTADGVRAADLARRWTAGAVLAPPDAAVTALAMAAGLLDRVNGWSTPPPDALVAATAPADWMCSVAVDHLRRASVHYATAAASGVF